MSIFEMDVTSSDVALLTCNYGYMLVRGSVWSYDVAKVEQEFTINTSGHAYIFGDTSGSWIKVSKNDIAQSSMTSLYKNNSGWGGSFLVVPVQNGDVIKVSSKYSYAIVVK